MVLNFRKIIYSSIILLVLNLAIFSVYFPTNVVSADNEIEPQSNTPLPTPVANTAEKPQESNTQQEENPDPGSSGISEWLFGWIKNFVLNIFYVLFVAIPVTIASFAGFLLNQSIELFIIEMSTLINVTTGIGFAINNLWTVIRDIMNIGFIFGLIYIGIKTILNSEDSSTRRTLGHLIAAALLINFSLLVTKVIIDFSNVAAVQIFHLIENTNASNFTGALSYSGITGSFFDATQISTLVSEAKISDRPGELSDLLSFYLPTMFTVMIFFLIATIVFVAGALMLLTRFVALILYMIFSPIMFLGWILPSFASASKKWWGGFFKQAFFAPAFMFMLYLSLITVKQLAAGILHGSDGNYAAALKLDAGAFGVVMIYVFAMGMLVASIVVAQQMGAAGAGATMGVLKGVQKNIQSFAGRNTVGRFGNWVANRTEANEATTSGRMRNRLLTAATLGTFDTQSRLKAAKNAKSNTFGGSRSYESQEKWSSERASLEATGKQSSDLKSALKSFVDAKTPAEKEANRQNMERAVADAPTSHILKMVKDHHERKLIEATAGELSDSQFKAIMDDKEINDQVKADLATARGSQVGDRLKRLNKKEDEKLADVKLSQVIPKADTSELKALGYKTALENAQYLTSKQISDWKDLTPTEKAGLKKARKDQLNETFDKEGAAAVFNRFKTDAERAKLPDHILTDDKATEYYNPKVLAKILDDDGIDSGVRDKIKGNIEKQIAAEEAMGPTPGGVKFDEKKIKAFNKFFDSPLGSQF